MDKQIKTELTRDELEKLLHLYNRIEDTVEEIRDSFDVRISHLKALEGATDTIRDMFNFRPPAHETGGPNHYEDRVLPDDVNAWYYEEDE